MTRAASIKKRSSATENNPRKEKRQSMCSRKFEAEWRWDFLRVDREKEEKVIRLPADSSAILMVDNVTGTVRLECILSITQSSRYLFDANAWGGHNP